VRADDLTSLRDLMQEKCIQKAGESEFVLASGLTTKYYYDGKKVTLKPRPAKVIGQMLLEMVREAGAEAVGGMTIGADPIAQSVALASVEDDGGEVPAFIVRAAKKDHGTREQTSAAFADDGGPLLRKGRKVAVVDDVVTTGGSVRGAIEAVEAMGCDVVLVIALVERHESVRALQDDGYNFRRLFYTDEKGDLFIDERLPQSATELSRTGVLR